MMKGVIIALALLPSLALAQSTTIYNKRGPACFARTYDRAHLANHPDQLVTSMMLALEPSGPVARGQLFAPPVIGIPFDFQIAMTKRGDHHLYVQAGYVENRSGELRGIVRVKKQRIS
jgi:hypothetical protein